MHSILELRELEVLQALPLNCVEMLQTFPSVGATKCMLLIHSFIVLHEYTVLAIMCSGF